MAAVAQVHESFESSGSFATNLITVAEQAHRDGEISKLELRLLRRATRFPRVIKRLEQEATEEVACDRGVGVSEVGAIDWVAILKELLPFLLQLLPLIFKNS